MIADDGLDRIGARAAFGHVPVIQPDQLKEPDAVRFGTPTRYGNDCSRQPTANDLAIARFQGKHVAKIAGKLAAR